MNSKRLPFNPDDDLKDTAGPLGESVYRVVLAVRIVLSLVSSIGLIGPFAQFIPPRIAFSLGIALFGVALGTVPLSLYLLVRRSFAIRGSQSPASLAAGLAAAGGWALLEGCGVFRWLGLLVVFTFLDIIVIPIILGAPIILFIRLFEPTVK